VERLGLSDGDEVRIVSAANLDGEWDVGAGSLASTPNAATWTDSTIKNACMFNPIGQRH